MIVSLDDGSIRVTQTLGKRLKYLIKRGIKEERYRNQQDFFDKIQDRIIESGNNDLAKVMVNNANTYNKYLSGGNNMKLEVLYHICKELNCTADYLLGLSPVNRNFLGSIYKVLKDMGYEVESNPENVDQICVMYEGKELYLSYNELEESIHNILDFLLFQKSKSQN